MEEGRIGIAGESYRGATLRKIKGKGGDRHTREEKSLRVMYHCTQKIFYEHGKSHFHPAPSICLSEINPPSFRSGLLEKRRRTE